MSLAQSSKKLLRLGLIVNPIAGVGGPAGLKGSDCWNLVNQTIEEGAKLRAPDRAVRCLQQLNILAPNTFQLVTCPQLMGEWSVQQAGLSAELINESFSEITSAEDTKQAAALLLEASVDLLLFVGGDGTARDICDVVAETLPVLGIPAGVKMQSGVFAVSPEAAAHVVAEMIQGDLVDVRSQEVRDIDEAAMRIGQVKSRYYGELRVPQSGHFVQQTKQGGVESEALVQDDIAAHLVENMDENTLYIVGAGTTLQLFMDQLGLDNTLLGIDVVFQSELLSQDVSAEKLASLVAKHEGPVVAMLSVTGNQGSLIGRGNQQLTPSILRRVGRDNVWPVATKSKIKALSGRPLLLDSNDPQLDRQWQGYITVLTGYNDSILYLLGTSDSLPH